MSLRTFIILVFLLLFAPAISAGEAIRPFVAGSLAKILAARQGKPFVLALWSVTCTHCPTELKALGKFRKSHPKMDVVLVAADMPEDAPLAAEMAARSGLGETEQWIFADDMPERLRFEIDQRWHGELPRMQFYDRDHRVEAVSGVVPQHRLAAWMNANVR